MRKLRITNYVNTTKCHNIIWQQYIDAVSMSEQNKQQYGFYMPDLKMFMTIDATKEEFQKILQQYSLEQKQEKARTSTASN